MRGKENTNHNHSDLLCRPRLRASLRRGKTSPFLQPRSEAGPGSRSGQGPSPQRRSLLKFIKLGRREKNTTVQHRRTGFAGHYPPPGSHTPPLHSPFTPPLGSAPLTTVLPHLQSTSSCLSLFCRFSQSDSHSRRSNPLMAQLDHRGKSFRQPPRAFTNLHHGSTSLWRPDLHRVFKTASDAKFTKI